MDKPIRPSGATRMGQATLYDNDEWLEVSPDVYDFFMTHPEIDENLLVGPYGYYSKRLGRTFVCIMNDTGDWVCAVSCINTAEADFLLLNKDDAIDDVIVALGYRPIPTSSKND